MSNLFNNLVNKIKSKKTINNLDVKDDYAFSLEEIDSLKEENDKKIKELKENRLGIKKEDELNILNVYKKLDGNNEEFKEELKENEILGEENLEEDYVKRIEEELNKEENNVLDKEVIEDTDKKENNYEVSEEQKPDERIEEEKEEDSYINLSRENQELIMKSWNSINNTEIDKDIIDGKDILSHNYNITYGDKAARFVHNIRKKYEIVICYLIGFNNEKNGIKGKTIFSDKVDNEWKYLDNYIKLLEKIRNFKK